MYININNTTCRISETMNLRQLILYISQFHYIDLLFIKMCWKIYLNAHSFSVLAPVQPLLQLLFALLTVASTEACS